MQPQVSEPPHAAWSKHDAPPQRHLSVANAESAVSGSPAAVNAPAPSVLSAPRRVMPRATILENLSKSTMRFLLLTAFHHGIIGLSTDRVTPPIEQRWTFGRHLAIDTSSRWGFLPWLTVKTLSRDSKPSA
jgi:hypothetical protein